MSITQTIEVPASHRLTLDVPREVPAGTVIITFSVTPSSKPKMTEVEEIELINRNAEWLNREMADVLLDQIDL